MQSDVVVSEGKVKINQSNLDYHAEVGALALNTDDPDAPVATLSYVAYFKMMDKKEKKENRPITFIYNGGPGFSSVWLHMGGLGPKRVVTSTPDKPVLPPYPVIDNAYSLLDVSDLVFIDAPGTGFGQFISHATNAQERQAQKYQKANEAYSIDGDAQAFAQFITQFLSRHQRWNTPRYLLGESYGTTRSVALANRLKTQYNVDVNGIILLSQYLSQDIDIDFPESNPGIDQPYYLALPTYAAIAHYYHRQLHVSEDLGELLREVELFSLGPYAQALAQGNLLPEKQKGELAEKLARYTGIFAREWINADLRLSGPVFVKKLLAEQGETVSRSDGRYRGASLHKMAAWSDYDPIMTIGSGFVSAYRDYLTQALKVNTVQDYVSDSNAISHWNMTPENRSFNLLPALSQTMKMNPRMKVMVLGGVYDLATPYFVAQYHLNHLSLPEKLRKNLQFHRYESGHLPYLDEKSLQQLHQDLSRFIAG
ncbi:MAG: S10 family peptidase [Symbiopectobacterium sp.]|uniref:S10 family peptidase n=1 Tax=Symbiopectobacterium sp. TaxID=2952789 RepID=UPI0039ECE672